MANGNSNYRENIKAFWKFVSGLVKCNKNRIETLVDDRGNAFSSHAIKAKILNSHYEKLDLVLDIQSFDDSWKEEVARSVKLFESRSFHNSQYNRILNQTITLGEIKNVVKAIKIRNILVRWYYR